MSVVTDDSEGYKPYLDGLRAVAVYLVVAFHAGIGRMAGGFIGVDVFFVLSGYLVTGILLKDLDSTGRIRLARFYARRARRLLPAAAVTLVGTAVVFAAIGSASEVTEVRDAVRAAALYFANWHFISRSTDYFAADVESNPLLHFWSLAVEEQFYLLWPVALWALHRIAGRAGVRARTALRTAVAVLALCSAVAALRVGGADLPRAYYGTDTRAHQLLAGALLALSPGLVARARRLTVGGRDVSAVWPYASLAAMVGILVLATSHLAAEPIERGLATTVLVVLLLTTLEAANGGVARRLLALQPVVYLGKVSYGTYLWHWPVIVVLTHELDLSPRAMLAAALPVATGLASLSYHLLELPVREAPSLDRWRPVTLASGLALSLLVGLVVGPTTLDGEPPSVRPVEVAGSSAARAGAVDLVALDAAWADVFDYDACPSSVPTPCTFTTGEGKTAIVVGDSHAANYAGMISEIARRHDMSLYGGLLSYCPWTRGIGYSGVAPDCHEDQARVFDEVIPAVDPDIVFLAHRPVDDPSDPMDMSDADAGRVSGRERDEKLAERIRSAISDLVEDDRTVVAIEPIPVAPADFDPIRCLRTHRVPEPCRFVTGRADGSVPEDEVLRDLDEELDEVVSIDLDRLVCPYLPICDPMVAGYVVRRDSNHLTLTYAETLARRVEERLVAEGVLDPVG